MLSQQRNKAVAAGLLAYGLPERVNDPVRWIVASRRALVRSESPFSVYTRLAGITDIPGQIYQGITKRLRAAVQTLIPHITTLALLEGPAFYQTVDSVLTGSQVDEEVRKKINNRISTMATTEAVKWIASQAGASSRDADRILHTIQAPKQGMLSVEELASYYTGHDLPDYCVKCRNSDYTKRGEIGCTVQDDPIVKDFLDRLQTEDFIFKGEKCPRFEIEEAINTPETDLNAGGVEKIISGWKIADTTSASMVKEVPLEPVSDFETEPDEMKNYERERTNNMDLYDQLEKAIERLLKNPTGENGGTYREIIRGILRDIRRKDHSTSGPVKDYSPRDWE